MKTLLIFLLTFTVLNADPIVLFTVKVNNTGLRPQEMGFIVHTYNSLADPQYADGTWTKSIEAGKSNTWEIKDSDFGEGWVILGMSQAFMGVVTEVVGNSYVATAGSSQTLHTGNFYEGPLIGAYEFSIGGEDDVNTKTGTPDFRKSAWLVRDTSLTSNLYREGVDKIVSSLSMVADTTGGDSMGSNITGAAPTAETVDVDIPTGDATATSMGQAAGKLKALLEGDYSILTGAPTGDVALSVTWPTMEMAGVTLGGQTVLIDPTEYSGPIEVFRALLLALLSVSYFMSIVSLIQGIFAESKTAYALSESTK